MQIDTFANRLQKALDDKKMKPIELANKTKLDKSLISNYLSGKYKAKQDKLSIIAEVLNVNEVWLMGYDVPSDYNYESGYHDNMFEEKLKNLIIEKYGSVRQFAFKIDVPYTTVDTILKRGIDNSNVGNVIKICKALNISIDSLLDNKDVIKANELINDDNSDNIDNYKTLFDKDDRLTPEQKEFFLDMIETQHRKFDEAQEKGNVN